MNANERRAKYRALWTRNPNRERPLSRRQMETMLGVTTNTSTFHKDMREVARSLAQSGHAFGFNRTINKWQLVKFEASRKGVFGWRYRDNATRLDVTPRNFIQVDPRIGAALRALAVGDIAKAHKQLESLVSL